LSTQKRRVFQFLKKEEVKRKKLFVLFLLLALVSNALAVTTYSEWTGLAGDGLWNTAGNWTAGVPLYTDSGGIAGNPNGKAGFKRGGSGVSPTFSSGTYGADMLVCGGAAGATTDVTIAGATINVSEYVTLAASATDYGQLTMNSGTINTGVNFNNTTFYVTQLGTGILNMNGGTINVGLNYPTPAGTFGNLSMTGSSGTTGNGTLYLYGGTIYANDLLPGTSAPKLLDITDGKLVLKTNRVAEITVYVDDGWLRTTKAGGSIEISYDALTNTTTVLAIPEPATICLLGIGALSLIGRKK
jgi:hypothetical protein